MKPKPPAAGMGRPKGALNKTTTAMKDAILHVYDDLQEKSGGENAHFRAWAQDNQTEFYKIASKLLPLDVRGAHLVNVSSTDPTVLQEEARREVAEMFGVSFPNLNGESEA